MTIKAWDVAGLTRDEWEVHSLDIRIRLAAGPYLSGWGYSYAGPKVLFDLPDAMGADGVELEPGEQQNTNCSTLTASILTSVFPSAGWTLREYGDLQVFADRLPENPDAPVQAVNRLGIGMIVENLLPGKWHLVQGWRTFDPSKSKYSGHAFLVLLEHDGSVLLLEATSRRNEGPRYRRTTIMELEREYGDGLHYAALDGP